MSKREPYSFAAHAGGTSPEATGQNGAARDAAPVFWKSLEQKADPVAAAKQATAEFPREISGDLGPVGRRGFVLGGLGAAMLAVEGCARRPVENILPYSKAPEYMLPGLPVHYATVRQSRGDAIGLVVENHEGRPTKIEGNPEHPSSFGGTDAITQASILDLYDPDRSTGPRKGAEAAKWEEFEGLLKAKLAAFAADGGAKLRILAQPTNSPSLVRLRGLFQAKFPQAKVYTWSPVNESNAREGARLAFGQVVNTICDYRVAHVVLSLDSDFLQTEPGMIRATKFFSRGRKLRSAHDQLNRLYVVEPSYTTTGANADHRLRLPATQVEGYVRALAKELSTRPGVDLQAVAQAFANAPALEGVPAKWIKVVADELIAARGRGVIVAGTRQPPRVHALVHALNGALGNAAVTVNYFTTADATEGEQLSDLKALVGEMDAGKVETLLMLGGNPVFDAPADLKFAEKLAKVPTSIHLAHNVDETSKKAAWHLPRAHELETWGDQRSLDGTLAIQQPMIAPLFGGRSDIEILGMFLGEAGSGYDIVRASLGTSTTSPRQLEAIWASALNRGLFAGPVARPLGALAARSMDVGNAFGAAAAKPLSDGNLEVNFAADPKLFDGRYGNNPWLLELPDLMTKITWDNAAMISPATAKALGLESGDVVTLSRQGAQLEIPVWILPGQADHSITLNLGWGRTEAGRYGNAVGFNAYAFRTSDALDFADGVSLQKTGKKHQLVQTQEHQSMEGRPIAIDATLAEYRKNPEFAQYRTPEPKTLPLWKPIEYNAHKWGMVIDLSSCTGCDACVLACQSENNIATVGKDQVYRNREMHWIRIDRYFLGDDEKEPAVALQPVACVQCEDAPCENVCPVNATAHSPEGLNDMAYNRCIGTRYCANNCPYKVRRFNYLEFQGGPLGSSADTLYGDLPETRKMAFNPDVTVRMRGVMEKCTYCVQRIQEAKIGAKRDDRALRDQEIVTACAQACPADAITFGDLNDPQARVSRIAKLDRGYHLLSELGTHPRTSYLGKIRNPNPAMEQG
ncbi:MAG TPA: TAT-variant-translocated molybdopterin oxidoreductase [Polyangiaceae bacterium]|jgi:molybdopterin-containing oxidoreductase family iron-sulfur binding subunit